VVDRLLEAGAIPIGKTNLDQFATGLVGTRSPYGVPRNPFNPELVPGGSSSGSAVAVATGLVSFALGTDTAGSGRVPAAFNNLVGLKPTRGWWSTRGVVPACRSLDCVCAFALLVEDAVAVGRIAGAFDPEDPQARRRPAASPAAPGPFRFGVPAERDREWFGDGRSAEAFGAALRRLEALGGKPVEIDFEPFRAAARLLYGGPWLAERWLAIREFHGGHADAILPVTRQIIEAGADFTAADAFAAFYELDALRRRAETVWSGIDALVLPTAPTIYSLAQVAADPIALNSRLGTYTNFANLLDCAALAVPAGFRSDGLPFGLTFFGPAWSDGRLAELGAVFQQAEPTTLGATGIERPASKARAPGANAPAAAPAKAAPTDAPAAAAVGPGALSLAVVGAHLRGQPLNFELTGRGARFVCATRTADCYRLYALAGTLPPKPGLVRVAPGGGASIEIEIWSMSPAAWGDFVGAIPPPLGIGTLLLQDGSKVKGFLCESIALAGADDITAFGGWRAYRQSLPKPS
jgi:allophanate hydrolase